MADVSEHADGIDSVSDEELSAWYERFRSYAANPSLAGLPVGGFPKDWGGVHVCDPLPTLSQLRGVLKEKGVTPGMLRRTWMDVLRDLTHNKVHNTGELWHSLFHAAGGTHG